MQKEAFSIYDASAGSGKTYTLVKEYLKIILLSKKPDAYRNILAITFTNKAVNEMKSRVVTNLSEFAGGNTSEKAQELMQTISAETGLSLNEIHLKAKSIIKNLIHNYAAFDISTIDKFTLKVIRTFAHDLKLPITFEVSLDTDALLTEAVDAIIARAGDDEEITKLLVDYTLEKTNDDKSWDVSREIMEIGKLLGDENNQEEIGHFNNKSISEFVEVKDRLVKLAAQIEEETSELGKKALELIDSKGVDIKSFSGGHFPKHLLSIQEKKFNPNNKTYHDFEDIKINKSAKDSALIESIIPDLLSVLASIYQKYEKKNLYEAFLKNITPLSLLNTLSNQLAEIQKDKNILSISEFNKLIYNQIQNQPAPFIYERMGEKYRHFFIDEFQDTSIMQWHNLIPLIHDSLSGQDVNGEKGSLLIVGDPKQSIYRWRGGKAEQFIELSKNENPFFNTAKTVEKLGVNRRSFSEIIEFNNDFFKFLSSRFVNDDYRDLYENHSRQEQNDKKGGYVSLAFLPKENADPEPESEEENPDKEQRYCIQILATIQNVIQLGFQFKDIVILVRSNRNATVAARYLTEQNVPVISSESLLLSASSEVKCIIHTLRYMNNFDNLEAKSNLLYYLSLNHPEKTSIHDFIFQGMEHKTELDFQNWLKGFGVEVNFKNLRKKSLYEATEGIISKVIPVKKRNAYVQYFLDVVLEKDIRNQFGISEFLYFWENKSDSLRIPSSEGNDAVKIMTIHKSKGLEFPVVIFPFAEENYSAPKKEKLWLEADEEVIGLPKALVSKNKSVESFGEAAGEIYQQKEQEKLLDNINVLYVALTRAEEQLYIISTELQPNKEGKYPNNLASFFVEYLHDTGRFEEGVFQYEFGDNAKLSSQKQITLNTKTTPQRYSEFNPDSIKIAQKESLMWDTKQQKAIEYGNLLHEILSNVTDRNDIGLAVTKALEAGLIEKSQEENFIQNSSKIVFHPELIEFFAPENKVFSEKTIIQRNEGLSKPDRIVIQQGKKALLLDYKTGEPLPKHRNQIENYARAIEEMGYQITKKVLVYIGEEIKIIHL